MAFTQFGPLQGEQILMKDIPDDFEMKELWQVRIKQLNKKKKIVLQNIFNSLHSMAHCKFTDNLD